MDKYEIIHTFNHPIMSLVGGVWNNIGIIDNIGNFYILGRPRFSLPHVDAIKDYSAPILMLKNVRQVDFSAFTFFCIVET